MPKFEETYLDKFLKWEIKLLHWEPVEITFYCNNTFAKWFYMKHKMKLLKINESGLAINTKATHWAISDMLMHEDRAYLATNTGPWTIGTCTGAQTYQDIIIDELNRLLIAERERVKEAERRAKIAEEELQRLRDERKKMDV